MDWQAELAEQLAGLTAPRWVVGYSGGLDSSVLLWQCVRWLANIASAPQVLAVHVNHQLSERADCWQQHCQRQCDSWGIPFQAECVVVDRKAGGLEQAARQARYRALSRHCRPGDALLLAHHRNDQVETILLRLLRGSGSAGVAGMCEQRDLHGITLVRPLLNVTREMLLRLAQQQGLNWIDDESNEDITIARNYLRHRVLPVLEQRWPNCATTLSRSARLISGEHQVLMRLIGRDCKSAIDQRQSLDLEPWRKRPDDEQLLWLRYWLGCFSELLPSEAVLQQIHQQVSNAAMDAQVCVGWGQWQVRRFRNRLWCIPSLPTPASDWSLGVSAGKEQPLGAELGVVRWQSTPLAAQPGLRAELLDKPLEWRLRQGGEHFKPAGRPRRALKKWLQDLHLPPWWRDRLPLLYWHDQLLLVPGLGATEGYAADAESPGLWAVWQPPATS